MAAMNIPAMQVISLQCNNKRKVMQILLFVHGLTGSTQKNIINPMIILDVDRTWRLTYYRCNIPRILR